MVVRSYDDEMGYIERINDHSFRIKKGFQPNMNVEVDSWAPQALWKSKFVWGANPTKKLWDVWPTLWLTSTSAMHVGYRHRPSRWDVRHMSVKHPNFFQLNFSTQEYPVRHAHCEYISLNSNIFPQDVTLSKTLNGLLSPWRNWLLALPFFIKTLRGDAKKVVVLGSRGR